MSFVVSITFEWLVIAVIPAVAILLVVFVFWQHRLQHRLYQQLQERLAIAEQQIMTRQADLAELRTGLIGVGQRVVAEEQQQQLLINEMQQLADELAQLSTNQQQLELVDPESKLYSRAVKMVQLGAGLEEIIRECELPRAEAELLLNLHRQHQ